MTTYKHDTTEYQANTGHLSLAEHGAYRLLLDAYHAAKKPLPSEKRILYRLIRAETPAERRAVDSVVVQFWIATPEGLINQTALAQMERRQRQCDVNKKIALDREKKRKGLISEDAGMYFTDGIMSL